MWSMFIGVESIVNGDQKPIPECLVSKPSRAEPSRRQAISNIWCLNYEVMFCSARGEERERKIAAKARRISILKPY